MADIRDIADKLLERTEQKKINWRPTVSEDTFTAIIGDWSVSISTHLLLRGHKVNLRVLDNSGQLLEEISATPSQGPSFGRLEDLHSKAKRSALGIDQQLEGLLAELNKV